MAKAKKQENSSISIGETKLKPLMPTLRTKKRFIKAKLECTKQYDFKDLSEKLTKEIMFYIGAIDYGNGGIWFLKDKFDNKTQEFTIKVNINFKDKLIGALALITKLDNNDARINILKVSGTLKGLQKDNKTDCK